MDFFEHITAGVLTKHMQQTNQIREFLTGSLFLTLLDSTAPFDLSADSVFLQSLADRYCGAVFSGLLAINIGVLLGPYRRRLEALYNAEGERQAMLVETIHGIQTVKALSMEPVQRKTWDQSSASSRCDAVQGRQDLDHRDHDFEIPGKTADRRRRLVRCIARVRQTVVGR